MIQFSKLHGAGNDFVLIQDTGMTLEDYQLLAQVICHRRFGVGADGLIVALKSQVADIKWHFINSDGSIGEMCGNGIRCFSNYVYEKNIVSRKRFRVETLDGIKIINIGEGDRNDRMIEVNMGRASEAASAVPVISEEEKFFLKPLEIDGQVYEVSAIRLGVPHSVVFVEDIEKIDVVKVGKAIETHPLFPEKTNVNFVQLLDRERLIVDTWERGAGHTYACGTGSCSALYISHLLGRADKKATIQTRGGNLQVDLIDDTIYMAGTAKFVYDGIFYDA